LAEPSEVLHPLPIRIRFGPAMKLVARDDDQIIASIDLTLRRMFLDLRADGQLSQA
jgi:hypothetical protein